MFQQSFFGGMYYLYIIPERNRRERKKRDEKEDRFILYSDFGELFAERLRRA